MIVEAALVFPVVFLLFFGIIEAGLFFATSSTTNNAAREGARYGASNFATSADRRDAADRIVLAVEESLDALTGYGTPVRVWIYKADPATGDPADPADCLVRCFRYTWDGSAFTYAGGSWATVVPGEVDACVGGAGNVNSPYGGVDTLGVSVQVDYRTVSGILESRTINHQTTMRIEPLPLSSCGS